MVENPEFSREPASRLLCFMNGNCSVPDGRIRKCAHQAIHGWKKGAHTFRLGVNRVFAHPVESVRLSNRGNKMGLRTPGVELSRLSNMQT